MIFNKVNILIVLLTPVLFSCEENDNNHAGRLECIAAGLQFAEGPAYHNNNLYFTDIAANKIYKWSEEDDLTIYKNNSGGANGMFFDSHGHLFVCEGSNKRVVRMDSSLNVTVIADSFNHKPFNEPNDLWISPEGNIYFSDPVFNGAMSQPGEYVYCVKVANGEVIRVISDLVKPNGIIGNAAGTKLYVADYSASIIYQYTILPDAAVTGKQVFASVQADGLSIDTDGNVYAASDAVLKFDPQGNLLNSLEVPGTLTNLCWVSSDEDVVYITTHNALYAYNP